MEFDICKTTDRCFKLQTIKQSIQFLARLLTVAWNKSNQYLANSNIFKMEMITNQTVF